MTRHEYQKRFGDFATAKEQEDIANAPRRGESPSAWLDRQINMLEKLGLRETFAPPGVAPASQQAAHRLSSLSQDTAMAYIHGMRHALSILEYFEDFTRRREGGEVEAWEDLAA